MHSWILASASPRRSELLAGLGLRFDTVVPDVDETPPSAMPPEALAPKLALRKCLAVAGSRKDVVVIAADTVVEIDGRILGKPRDIEEAAGMLRTLSGRTHRVYTGLAVCYEGRSASRTVCTEVAFKALDETLLGLYLRSGEPLDKAGAYGIQGAGALLVESIKGDYFNVVGLPVSALYDLLLKEFDINLFMEASTR